MHRNVCLPFQPFSANRPQKLAAKFSCFNMPPTCDGMRCGLNLSNFSSSGKKSSRVAAKCPNRQASGISCTRSKSHLKNGTYSAYQSKRKYSPFSSLFYLKTFADSSFTSETWSSAGVVDTSRSASSWKFRLMWKNGDSPNSNRRGKNQCARCKKKRKVTKDDNDACLFIELQR